MDLRIGSAAPTELERSAVAEVLGPEEQRDDASMRVVRGGRAARDRRHLLLPALHSLQRRVGWISPGGLNHVASRLPVPPAEAYGVATFYSLFSTTPRAGTVLHICDDVACVPRGADALCADAERILGREGSGDAMTWHRSPCLGACERGPAVFVQRTGAEAQDETFAPVDAAALAGLASGAAGSAPTETASSAPQTADPAAPLRLLARVGRIRPASIEDYRAAGGFGSLARAIELGPEGVVAELRIANLLGRGGAAFPTAAKWEAVLGQAVTDRVVVCNADESEPGTFKDRVLMENDPYSILEGLVIAGLSTRATRGFVYLRGEYPLAEHRMTAAIGAMRAAGLLGPDVAGTGRGFDIELRRGAGAYICGEETALFASIEGHRGEPRSKPPFPVERGLFGLPTAVNNVETLASVVEVLRVGGAAFAEIGTSGSTGTRLFCVSGCVTTPGVYEVPCGTPLADLITLAGGVRDQRALRSVLLGGASGSFVGPDALGMPLSFEAARAAGVSLGSGVVAVFDDTVDMASVVRRIARFFREESCGQCVPCRVGTVRQGELLDRLDGGTGDRSRTLDLIGEVGTVMRDASICGLGQTAGTAVASAVALGLLDGGSR